MSAQTGNQRWRPMPPEETFLLPGLEDPVKQRLSIPIDWESAAAAGVFGLIIGLAVYVYFF
jgi:hypothetical protein